MFGFGNNKIADRDILKFFQTLYRYQRGGVSIDNSVRYYADSTSCEPLKEIAEKISRDLANGVSFPEAVEKHDIFPHYVPNLLVVGIKTAQITNILEKIIANLEQTIDVKRKIKSATLMPKISFVILLGTFFFGTGYVIPKMTEILKDLDTDLPLITEIVMAVGDFMQSYWWLLVLLLFLSMTGFSYVKKNYPERVAVWELKIPIWKDISYYQTHYNFCQIMGLCLTSGVPIDNSLQYTALSAENVYVKNMLTKAIVTVSDGIELDKAIKQHDTDNMLDPELAVIMRTGAMAGDIAQVLSDEAEIYRKELVNCTDTIGDKISFAVLVPLYVVVLVILAAVEYPIFSMIQGITEMAG